VELFLFAVVLLAAAAVETSYCTALADPSKPADSLKP
jgi:hypothetical protein